MSSARVSSTWTHAPVAVAILVFAGALALFSERATFPYFDHPDEPGKVYQVIHRSKNFHHPMLMLSSAILARRVFLHGGAEEDWQRVAEVGRRVVAIYAAAAGALLALLAARLLGVWAGLAAGLLVVTHPLLYELAHYLKEDTTLLFGLVACALAAEHLAARRSTRALVLLGAAAGIAAAGKYVGAGMVPAALAIGARLGGDGNGRGAWKRAGVVAASAATVWVAVNYRLVRYAPRFWQSLGDQTHVAYHGKRGLAREVPHAFYFAVQSSYGGWWVPALVLPWLAFALHRPRQISIAEWLLAAVSTLFLVALSLTPQAAQRYYLPTAITLCLLAALGVFRWAALASARSPRLRVPATSLAFLLCAGAAALQWRDTQEIRLGFRRDDRAELLQAVAALPHDAFVVQDQAARLPEPERRFEDRGREPLPQRVLGAKQAPDLGSLAELRARGVTHLALCESAYGTYFAADRAVKDSAAVDARRAFYRTAMERGRVLREWKRGRVVYLQPGLVLIDISGLAPADLAEAR